MALLAALGLMAASFLSFPVAAFFSLAMLVVFCRAARWRNGGLGTVGGGQRGNRHRGTFGRGRGCLIPRSRAFWPSSIWQKFFAD
jgi:hypothetical protein